MRAELPAGPSSPALLQTAAWARDPVRYMEGARERFGPVWTSRLVGFDPLVHVSSPEAVRDVFTGDIDALQAGAANAVLEPILGSRSLFLLDGQDHLARRRIVMPVFARSAMRSYTRTFAALTERAVAGWPRDTRTSFYELARSLTLDVILDVVLGLGEDRSRAELARDLAALLDGASHPIMLMRPLQVRLGPLTPWSRLMSLKASIDQQIYARIAESRRRGPTDDVLSLLAAATDGEGALLSPAAVRDELMTLIVAGHDTVATALAWTAHHLLENPDVHAKAVQEAVGPSDEVPYLDAVIMESLRLTPVLPIVARRLTRDTRIGGVLIPRGARVAPNAYLSHRESDAWIDPLQFRPERFVGAKPSPYTYFPFGGGARRCIGMGFARLELRVLLRGILCRLHLRGASRAPVRPVRRGVTLAPSEGLPVLIDARGSLPLHHQAGGRPGNGETSAAYARHGSTVAQAARESAPRPRFCG